MLARALIAASAAVIAALGLLHLAFAFLSDKFRPRDPQLEVLLKSVAPRISAEMTMWKAWIGFNASHSLGAILFGAVYGYLAVYQHELLLGSDFLIALGALMLAGYLVLGRLYWFSVPFSGIALASVLYGAGYALARG